MTAYEGFTTLLVEKKEKYVIVTLNRPKVMNTMNDAMKDELVTLFRALEKDPEVFGVILTGEGRAFCAGTDVSQGQNAGGNPLLNMRDYVGWSHDVYSVIESYPHPVIAAVNGYALGGGTELCLVSDLRIASTAAVFGLPESNLGVIPCYGGTQRLPRLIGTGYAKDMIFTGRHVKAEEAKEMRLVNEVVAPEELMNAAESKMQQIVAKAPLAVKLAKAAINKGVEMPLHYALEMEMDMTGLLAGTEDAREGGMAFFQKRPPEFKNK